MITPEYESGLVEAAVLAAARGHPAAARFTRERDPLYEIEPAEAREAAFADHHTRWFEVFGLGRPLRIGLDETPDVERRCARCVVAAARLPRDECADLLVTLRGEPAVMLVRIAPETLGAPARALALLRRELLHVADMLDPAFGYVPDLGDPDGEPAGPGVRERYRVLWDCHVDGRLARAGRGEPGLRALRQREFARAFPELGGEAPAAFDRLWAAGACTHRELATLAAGTAAGARRWRCSLCRAACAVPARDLPPDARAALAADFPGRDPAAPVCARCAELYAARPPHVPGWPAGSSTAR